MLSLEGEERHKMAQMLGRCVVPLGYSLQVKVPSHVVPGTREARQNLEEVVCGEARHASRGSRSSSNSPKELTRCKGRIKETNGISDD